VVVARNPEAISFDPSESLGARWVSFEEALSIIDEAPLRRLIRKGERLANAASADFAGEPAASMPRSM
jgi:hypothetical protein